MNSFYQTIEIGIFILKGNNMKKTLILSLLTTAITNSVNATEIYNDKGLAFEVNGDLQVQLRKKLDIGKDLNVEFDDLEIETRVDYTLTDSLAAFGQLSADYKNAGEGKTEGAELSDAFIGLTHNTVSVSIGMQDYATDDFGVEEAYEMEADSSGFDTQGTDGDDVIRVDIEQDWFTLALSTELESAGADSEGGKSYDLFATTTFNAMQLGLAYQSKADAVGADLVNTYGVSVAYDAGFATVAADYSEIDDDSTVYNIAATYKATKFIKVRVGLVGTEPVDSDSITEWYTNVTYKFPTQKKLSVFAEISDSNGAGFELGYLAGMRLKF